MASNLNTSSAVATSSHWFKQFFCAFPNFACIPSSLLTGIIRFIYKGKGKGPPLSCHSYGGITMTSVVMKLFEYTSLYRILLIFQGNGHLPLTQTAHQKHISYQDALFATHKAIVHTLQEGRVAYLSLYNQEKAFDFVEHSILLQLLYQAGINGKVWRLIKAYNGTLTAVVKSGSSLSHTFSVTHGIQQGSVLSPTFFLVVMDKLLNQLRECSTGTSFHCLYLG